MSAEYGAFARPNFTAAHFAREESAAAGSEDTGFAAAPVYARPTATAKRTLHPVIWVAVPALALALGAGAMFLNKPHEAGIAQLTPGQPTEVAALGGTTTDIASAPITTPAPEVMPAQPTLTPAARTQPPAVAPVRREAHATPAARARPAARTPSAAETGMEASATLPGAPIPYSATAQTPAAAPPIAVAPPVNPEPAAPSQTEAATPQSSAPGADQAPVQ